MADFMWKPIKSYRGEWPERVDIWLTVHASPMSMGIGDQWRVVDSFRRDKKWFHIHEGKEAELVSHYITHWMRIKTPDGGKYHA